MEIKTQVEILNEIANKLGDTSPDEMITESQALQNILDHMDGGGGGGITKLDTYYAHYTGSNWSVPSDNEVDVQLDYKKNGEIISPPESFDFFVIRRIAVPFGFTFTGYYLDDSAILTVNMRNYSSSAVTIETGYYVAQIDFYKIG